MKKICLAFYGVAAAPTIAALTACVMFICCTPDINKRVRPLLDGSCSEYVRHDTKTHSQTHVIKCYGESDSIIAKHYDYDDSWFVLISGKEYRCGSMTNGAVSGNIPDSLISEIVNRCK